MIMCFQVQKIRRVMFQDMVLFSQDVLNFKRFLFYVPKSTRCLELIKNCKFLYLRLVINTVVWNYVAF